MSHKAKDIVALSEKESKLIIQQSIGPRSGSSGGIVFPDTNSKSLSKCTEKNRVMLGKRKSVACSVSYSNKYVVPHIY